MTEAQLIRWFYGSMTLHEDGRTTWNPNPLLEMTPDEQWMHNVKAGYEMPSAPRPSLSDTEA